jgi:FkbM family methyltransferase
MNFPVKPSAPAPRRRSFIKGLKNKLGERLDRFAKIVVLARQISWADAVRLTGGKGTASAEIDLFLRALNRQVTIRPDTSDLKCFEKVFIREEYFIPFETNPRLIVDAGANIGLATLYFAGKFPQAKIVAIEPEASNYELLLRNCSGMTTVTPMHAAIWNSDTSLRIANLDAEKWGFTVEPSANGASVIKALTIPQILAQSDHGTIDILKLDVEGAERELFCDGCEEWLPRVKMIIIELHDRNKPGTSHAVYSKLCQFPFSQEVRGENIFIFLGGDFLGCTRPRQGTGVNTDISLQIDL